ncbi:MAG: monovalent cation/H+ antiporter complex subunit F [bacterium]|nr:monovalent cation/H+ antiporter complex subunit F [bacterium]
MRDWYQMLFTAAALVIGVCMLLCLIRAIRGPRIADRVIAINMMGTLTVTLIFLLGFLRGEGYLADIALIYTTLSFLAVVLLSKIYIGIYHEARRKQAVRQKEEQS